MGKPFRTATPLGHRQRAALRVVLEREPEKTATSYVADALGIESTTAWEILKALEKRGLLLSYLAKGKHRGRAPRMWVLTIDGRTEAQRDG